MKPFIRRLLPASLVLCALAGSIPSTGSAQGAHGRRVVRHTVAGARVLCGDGSWGYANRGGCARHEGIAVRQPTYHVVPRASARARIRANAKSAVAGSGWANTVRARAIARCNDGTYWHSSSRRGACHAHGGVSTWL